MAQRVGKEELAKLLAEPQPVLVDFYTDSCIACKQMSPVLGDLEDAYAGKAKVVKVNAAFDTELAEKYSVMAAPTLVFFKDQAEVQRFQGVVPKETLQQVFDKLV